MHPKEPIRDNAAPVSLPPRGVKGREGVVAVSLRAGGGQ